MTVFENIVNTLAKQLEIDPALITADTNILGDLGADSLDLVELVMELEKTYNIIIANEAANGLTTVGEIAAFIEQKMVK